MPHKQGENSSDFKDFYDTPNRAFEKQILLYYICDYILISQCFSFNKFMKITENNIIESLKSGEEQAFRYIYDKYYGYLCAIAKGYLSDNDAAETVVGDVIYNIWEIRKNLNIHTSLRSYLIRSVKNRSINYLQQEYIAKEISINSLQDYTEIESFYFIEEEHPLEKMLETELEKTIKSAIHTLPDECRTAFIETYAEPKPADFYIEPLSRYEIRRDSIPNEYIR